MCRPWSGRTFGSGDSEEAGSSPVVVLSHRFWARRFKSDPGVVGRTLYLNGYPFSVVGVAREGFLGMTVVAPDVWVPASMIAALSPESGGRLLTHARGRLDDARWPFEAGRAEGAGVRRDRGDRRRPRARVPGEVRLPAARTWSNRSLVRLERRALVAHPVRAACHRRWLSDAAHVDRLGRAGDRVREPRRRPARARVVRRREIAVRTAIGAGRGRVVRQLLTETTLLFALGGLAGLLLARVLTSLLVSLLPAFPVPVNVSVPLDGRVVAFSLVVSFVAALLCGLAPALHASKSDVVSALKDDAPAPTDRLRLRNTFVVAQVAFSVLLVITAAILVRDVDRVTSVDRGFDSHQVDVASVDLSMAGYTARDWFSVRAPVDRARARDSRRRGRNAERSTARSRHDGDGRTSPSDGVLAAARTAGTSTRTGTSSSRRYFATLRIPLSPGATSPRPIATGRSAVAIIGESAAKRFFPGKSALGQVVHVHAAI